MADIDNLTIQITAEATDAINALNGLSTALNAVNDALDRLNPDRMRAFSQATEDFNRNISNLAQNGAAVGQVANNLNNAAQQMGNVANVGNAVQNVSNQLNNMARSANTAQRALRNVSRASAGGAGFRELIGTVRTFLSEISNASVQLSFLGKMMKGVFGFFTAPVKMATKAIQGLGKANDATAQTAKRLAKELTRVSKMLKLMVTRMALRAVIKEVSNGFKSLALHSEEFNQTMSSLMNGTKKLGYSFSAMVAPLIQALAPALIYIINLLTRLMNALNQVFSALSGGGTWNKAKDFTNNWADDIKSANKQAKELKKTVLGFDELNQLQEKYTGGGDTSGNITDMFETLPIEDKWKDVANYIKKTAKRLFEPIKNAWEKVGDFVKRSWKYAMEEIGKLGESVARDFWKVWEQEKTQKIFENILKIIGWIGQAVGNLAKRFREAWDKNDTGLHILENIRDIVLIITDHFESMAKATAEWADSLDFSPILEQFNEWLESCKEPADALMGILEDIYTDYLLPIGKWAIEEGGKQLLKVFTDFNNEVKWDVIRERLDRVWQALVPFTKTVGEGLIKFIDQVADKVRDFLNSDGWNDFIDSLIKWMNNVDADDIAHGLEVISGALASYFVLKSLGTVTTAITELMTTLSAGFVVGNIILVLSEVATTIEILTKDIKAYKEMLGADSLWEALTNNSKSAKAKKQEYANQKSSNPYNGNREDSQGFSWENLWKAMSKTSEESDKLSLKQEQLYSVVEKAAEKVQDADGKTTSFTKAMEGMKSSSDNASTAFSKVVAEMNKSKDSSANASTSFSKVVDGLKEVKTEAPQTSTSFSNALNNISKSATTLDTNTAKSFSDVAKNASAMSAQSNISFGEFYKGSKVITVDMPADFANAQIQISGTEKTMTKDTQDAMNDMNKAFDTIKDAMKEDKWTFQGVIDGLKKTFGEAVKGIKDKWNELTQINGDVELGGGKFKIKFPKFAGGGFPENGLFFANSTEMVGRFSNGKTAVANNEQIVQGISAGVYSAVSSALAGNNNNGGYISNTIVVDGEVIARTVTKAQQKQQMRYSPQMV